MIGIRLRMSARIVAIPVVAAGIGLAVPPGVALAQVDPVARKMAQQALDAATAPAITKTTIVGGERPDTPAAADPANTLGKSPIQVNGSVPDDTGYMAFKYGADGKGVTNFWVKTRGTTMNSYDAVQLGDRVVVDVWQAGTGSQTGHVGGTRVTIDNANFTAGEVAGRWALFTGTGIHRSQATKAYPMRFGSLNAIVANSYQQVLFPGGVTGTTAPPSSNFGGWVVIGAGAPTPGFGALKFLTAGAALLTTPEAGAFEVDAAARPYFTTADGVRRSVVLADTAAPTVRVLAQAGPGASATIDASGTSGVVTFRTGAAAAPDPGDLFAVTYAHPYPSASYPVITAANPAAVALVRGSYVTATARGFTVSLPPGSGTTADTAYAITFSAPGR